MKASVVGKCFFCNKPVPDVEVSFQKIGGKLRRTCGQCRASICRPLRPKPVDSLPPR